MSGNTLFLRLEGPLQAWGNNESKFVVRRTARAPTKSGVIGMLCAALGQPREEARQDWLPRLAKLEMGVRVDRPGVRWWDYHTVGARMMVPTAEGKSKPGAILSRREYLCDASFLVALRGGTDLIGELEAALREPKFTVYLGRKSCPPSRPLLEAPAADFPGLIEALKHLPWAPRLSGDEKPGSLDCLIEWRPTAEQTEAPAEARMEYDVPVSFEPPAHEPRLIVEQFIEVGGKGGIKTRDKPLQSKTNRPPRPRADYGNSEYKKRRLQRLNSDRHLCVFCKSPATTVQHITYMRAGGEEEQDDLRSMCRLCHDAATMLEYGHNMGMERIDPEDPNWREALFRKRQEIVEYRSRKTRARRLEAREVE